MTYHFHLKERNLKRAVTNLKNKNVIQIRNLKQ